MTTQELIAKRMKEAKEQQKNTDAKVAAIFENMKKADETAANKIVENFRKDMISAGKRFFGEKYFD